MLNKVARKDIVNLVEKNKNIYNIESRFINKNNRNYIVLM